jgi:hypothetical protein
MNSRNIVTAVLDYIARGKLAAAGSVLLVGGVVLPAQETRLLMLARQRCEYHAPPTHAEVLGQKTDADENEVSTEEVEKYVSVYKAMQRNRSLTVDQAAAAKGLTLEQFRHLEDRVQRDDAALQQARDELQAAARSSPASAGVGPTSHP